MKKVALLIALMTIIALTAFAADIAVTVSGSSELTFGVNLADPAAAGFTNANASCVSFTLVSGSSTKGAEEAVYGMIEVSGWGVTYKSDDGGWAGVDEGDVTAKIVFPSGWVKISGTNNSLNFLNIVQNDNAVAGTDDKGINDSVTSSGGFVLGLNFAPIALELGVFSENDWTQSGAATAATAAVYDWIDSDSDPTTAPTWGIKTAAVPAAAAADDYNDDMAFGANLKATLDVAPVKVEAGFEMAINSATDTGMGAGVKLSANIAPITIYAAADFTIDTTTAMEFGGGLSLAIAGITLSADVSFNDTDDLDTRIKIDAGGMVPNLGLSLTVELFNIDTDLEYSVAGSLSYNAGKVKPYANVRYGTFTAADNAYTYVAAGAEPFKLNIGMELYVITNVTFVLDYNSDDIANDNGIIKFVTKIAL